MKDTGRNEPEDELSITNPDGMTSVVAALIASDNVEMRREYVNDLTLAFVAPLGTHHHNCRHVTAAFLALRPQMSSPLMSSPKYLARRKTEAPGRIRQGDSCDKTLPAF